MPILKKQKANKNKSGVNYTITSTVAEDPNNTVVTVQVDIINAGGQPIAEPSNYTLQFDVAMNGMRLFKNESIYFNTNAIGFEYEMTFTMYDMYGNIIPSSVTKPIVIEQLMVLA